MILQCPECETKYAVAENAIPKEGKTVRCAKCKHEWFEQPSQPEGEAAEGADGAEEDFGFDDELLDIDAESLQDDGLPGQELPSLSEPAGGQGGWKFAAAAMFVLFLGSLFFQAREALYPFMPGLYQTVGYYPTDGLVLADLSIEPLESRRKERFAVNCALVNRADEPRMQPPLAMRIVSKGGNVLAEDDAYLPAGDRPLQPGDRVDCGRLEVSHKFNSADKLMLEIASSLEMGLRSTWSPEHRFTAPAITLDAPEPEDTQPENTQES